MSWKTKLEEWETIHADAIEAGAHEAAQFASERIEWLKVEGPKSVRSAERDRELSEAYHQAKNELKAALGAIEIGTVDPEQALRNEQRRVIAQQALNRRTRERTGARDIAASLARQIDLCGLAHVAGWRDAWASTEGVMATSLGGRAWEPTSTMLINERAPSPTEQMWYALAELYALREYPEHAKRPQFRKAETPPLDIDGLKRNFELRRQWVETLVERKRREAERTLQELSA